MKRLLVLAYGVAAYLMFLGVFLYAIGFIGNLWVPTRLDGPPTAPFTQALLVNLVLLGAFAVQHSLMARPFFKRWLTRFIPEAAERSTYVMMSNLALIALFAFWQPMGGMVWQVDAAAGRALIWAAFAFGWVLLLYSTFLINHFDLFGLRQVWLYWNGRPYTALPFKTVSLYRWMRHPLYLGWLFIFWSTPTMTVAHLVFALATTAYILIAIRFEEHDLTHFHPEYAEYRRQVPMIVPVPGKSVPATRHVEA